MNGFLGLRVEIDHYGFSGWTTDQLLSNADKNNLADFTGHTGPGIKIALSNKKYDLMILMAGTNDLGYRSKDYIFNNLQELTQFALGTIHNWRHAISKTHLELPIIRTE